MTLPNWVKKHRKPKQEIKNIGGRFYVYEVSSEWDPESKRTRKISGKLLGKITKDKGFESREKYGAKSVTVKAPILSKEWGVTNLITLLMKDSVSQLEKFFPEEWQQIVVTAYSRLLYQSPLKNISLHFEHSYFSNLYPECSVGSKVIGLMIQSLGAKREQIRKYFKATSSVASDNDCMLIDGTHILSRSAAEMPEIGYNSQGNYSPQVNLLYIFAKDSNSPIYYRLTPGNIREVKSFKLSLKESGLESATVIADKGFYSKSNIQELEDNLISYIIPLQRSSSLIDYAVVTLLDKKKLSGYFIFAGRTIWYHCQGKVTLFLDEELRLAEERDYLKRIETHPEEYTIESFHSKSHTFGTLAILSNLTGTTPQMMYSQYKSRGAIEQLFDSLKNLLQADRTYMRTDEGLEGWMFVNHVALTWYYRIYSALLATDLLSKFSVNDVLLRAAKIQKIQINDSWFTTEVTAKTQKLLSDIACPVT
jgi:transposase